MAKPPDKLSLRRSQLRLGLLLLLSGIQGCASSPVGEQADGCASQAASQQDLVGTWSGSIGDQSVTLTVDENGQVSGGGVQSTWSIDTKRHVSGGGSLSALSGSQLLVASASWSLTLDLCEQRLSGTVDGAAPGLHDLRVSLHKPSGSGSGM